MKRVVVIHWKGRSEHPFEVFSNLKILCEQYPVFKYNTLNNYLSKLKLPYDKDDVRIERKLVLSKSMPKREIKPVLRRVNMRLHDEEKQNLEFWLSRPVAERISAVTRLSAQLKKNRSERMDKTVYRKRKQ
jgi:hypothetical protein